MTSSPATDQGYLLGQSYFSFQNNFGLQQYVYDIGKLRAYFFSLIRIKRHDVHTRYHTQPCLAMDDIESITDQVTRCVCVCVCVCRHTTTCITHIQASSSRNIGWFFHLHYCCRAERESAAQLVEQIKPRLSDKTAARPKQGQSKITHPFCYQINRSSFHAKRKKKTGNTWILGKKNTPPPPKKKRTFSPMS